MRKKIMALVKSRMVELGSRAFEFELLDAVSGKKVSLAQGRKATLVMFICNHCPYVKHLFDGLVKLGQDYQGDDTKIYAISSNDVVNYPQDSPEKMKELALELGFNFPYLYDETQEVAKSYGAECTPDFFLYNDKLELAYRGQFDDSSPGKDIAITGRDIRAALDALLSENSPLSEQTPSMGCSIKWS